MSDEMSHPRRRVMVTALLVALVAVVADQTSKAWAVRFLGEGDRRPLIGDFISLQLIRNSGAALSLGSKSTWVFTLVAIVVVIGIGVWLPRVTTYPTACALGLLGGGAIGNLVDRLIQPPSIGQGHVVDFINYHGFFIGNVADIWIVIGAIWLAGIYAFSDSDHQKTRPSASEDDARAADE